MSEKAFGIKKIEIKGSGIPTIDSPTDLYLNAVNVSISTDVTIGRNINVSGVSTLGAGVTVTGTTFTNQLSVSGVSTFRGTNSTQVHLGNDGYAGVTWSGIGGVYSGNEPSILTNSGLGLDISGGIGNLILSAPTTGRDVIIKAGNFAPTAINCVGNAQVELYNNGDKKFETIGTGVTITGTTFTNHLSVSGVSTFSSGAIVPKGQSIDFGDLQIFTNTPGINNSATTLLYTGSNDFQVISDNFKIKTTSGFFGSQIKADFSGSPILYYATPSSSSPRLQITDYGVKITGLTSTTDLNVSGSVGFGTTNPGYYLDAGSYPTTLTSTKLTVGSVGSAGTTLLVNGEAIIDGMNIHCGGSGPIWNAYFGYNAGKLSNGGNLNAAFGASAFLNNVSGNWNAAFGANALQNSTGNENSAFGSSAGSSVTGGQGNTLIGRASGTSITNGFSNTFLGSYSGNQTTGSGNLFLGSSSGQLVTSGAKNVIIGSFNGSNGSSGLDIVTSSNNIVIADGDANVRFYANSSGNVGLGTINPTSKLTVNGGIQLAQNNATIVGTSGTAGEIKQIAGAPFYYDGSAWREFVLSSGTPVTVPADTEWDNVVFRATFDTDFTDAKFGATPVYVSAGSSIVGAAVTIGTGAFRNDGTLGAGVSYAYRSDYDFTGSWTIEFWMYVDSGPVYTGNPIAPTSLISMNSTTGIGTSGNFSLSMWRDQYGNVYIGWYNQNHPTYKNGITLYNVAGSTWNNDIIDKWNHFALVREGDNGSIHFYINGTEHSYTVADQIIDNDILDISGNGLHFGGDNTFTIGGLNFNSVDIADVIFDDVRISCGVGTAGQRYNSVGIYTAPTFTPPTTALPTAGTLSSYVQPPGDKYGEITLGGSPTWRGTSGVTVSQQSSGNYRVSFASTYTNVNDYFVLTQTMDQGFASYVGVARSTTHVDFAINRESDDSAVNTGSLSVQIKNHI